MLEEEQKEINSIKDWGLLERLRRKQRRALWKRFFSLLLIVVVAMIGIIFSLIAFFISLTFIFEGGFFN